MNLVEFEGKRPQIHPDAWVAPTATLIGDVRVEAGASVWYGVVIRADICTIVIAEGTNVQDGTIMHAKGGQTLVVGPNSTVGHGCVIHGLRVGERTLIGNGAVLSDDVEVSPGSVVGAGALVPPGMVVPPDVVVAGVPAKVRGPVEPDTWPAILLEYNAKFYVELSDRYGSSARVLEDAEVEASVRSDIEAYTPHPFSES
ncbi:gamma carbonic anhydrase family protein [Nocardioides massiliensis]|uniref:Carbonic anhydrase/acetyltransferase-like protein (Isoleucine patch superfamily) n=1 Tax=Nocardioides massiliensis TaxID=1325935 RepID=A0ABT9NUV6_9ACTN|nr:gamma carbonic anhydrase family protein [Nocardioides massiliensis]MDP9824216.1 carbonic anhydrase/acetyltransferase-like protein (isoleucine patch superfamily) [Nocardioides massiliensis]